MSGVALTAHEKLVIHDQHFNTLQNRCDFFCLFQANNQQIKGENETNVKRESREGKSEEKK